MAIAGVVALSGAGRHDVAVTGVALAVAAGCSFPAYGFVIQRLVTDRRHWLPS